MRPAKGVMAPVEAAPGDERMDFEVRQEWVGRAAAHREWGFAVEARREWAGRAGGLPV